MRTITVGLYPFSELNQEAKEKALKCHWDINLHHDWWEDVYEDFIYISDLFGFIIDEKAIFFSSINGQGAGSTFKAEVDLLRMMLCIQGDLWKPAMGKDVIHLVNTTFDQRLIKLIKSGRIFVRAWTNPANYGSIRSEFVVRIDSRHGHAHPCIESAVVQLEKLFHYVSKELNKFLFSSLQMDYEFRTSEVQVQDSILYNEHEFLKDGSIPPAELLHISSEKGEGN